MKTFLIVSGCLAAAFVVFLVIYNQWAVRQRLLGVWFTSTPDGSLIAIQFEGSDTGGTYKQLIKRGDTDLREFGHWVRGSGFIKMIIMATEDVASKARTGQDTLYKVSWISANSFKIDGPERDKWRFKRSTKNVRIAFDAPPRTTEQSGGANSRPAGAHGSP